VNLRILCAFASLILAFSVSSYAQSLGDVARQTRAERQNSTSPHARIITNDDIADSERYNPALPKEAASKVGEKKEDEATALAENVETETGEPKKGKTKTTRKDPAKEREAQEVEILKRTHEINQQYLDRIAALRTQINTAQLELARLQRDQVESTNSFRQTLGLSPNPSTYEQQQRLLSEQIAAQRDSIIGLSSQLDDAQESARHAGVPHVTE
jgi:hypothetical protein